MSSLKAIVEHAVERVGGQIAAAKLLGVSATEISLWCNPNNERYIPLDHLVDLSAACGDLPLKELAEKRGYDMVPREVEARADDESNVFKVIAEFSKATGALGYTTLQAAADHKFTPNERREIRRQMRPVKDCLEELDRVIA